jgi:hypothetical protein
MASCSLVMAVFRSLVRRPWGRLYTGRGTAGETMDRRHGVVVWLPLGLWDESIFPFLIVVFYSLWFPPIFFITIFPLV